MMHVDQDLGIGDLPKTIPVFPLSNALLLPGGRLPLNIFEPRYLSMIDRALGQGRFLGMIQPLATGKETVGDGDPDFDVGCLGRIVSFGETEDGRYVISLVGCCRFTIQRELALEDGYRRFDVSYGDFAGDLRPREIGAFDRESFVGALERYLLTLGSDDHWKPLLDLDDSALISTTAMVCPFSPEEKQAILECGSIKERAELVKSLIDMAFLAGQADGTSEARH